MQHELSTLIDAVTVYQGGARITHVGTIKLPKGEIIVKISELTKFLDKESVRVRGTGTGTIVNVNVERHTSKLGKNVEVEALKEKLKLLRKKEKYLQEDLGYLQQEGMHLVKLSETFYKRIPVYYGREKLELSKIQEMEGFIHQKETTLHQTQRELTNSVEKVIEEIALLQMELNQLGSSSEVISFYEILINLHIHEPCEFSFNIEFQVPRASWRPFYDVNLEEKQAHIKLLADVMNNTGENWDNVQLEISSANLRPVRIVKPTSLLVREWHPRKPMREKSLLGTKGRKMAKPKLIPRSWGLDRDDPQRLHAMALELGEARAPPKLQEMMAQIDESVGVQSYKLPTRLSIPSDRNPHPVILIKNSLSSEKSYFWSIAAPDQTIIQDTITNGDILLLPGNAKVYYKGEFVGEAKIPLIAPHEQIDIGTRRSYDVKVEKKILERSQAKEGFLKGKIVKSYKYELKIKILKETPYSIKIMDRIVHSDSEKIKILNAHYSIEPKNKELGILSWNIELKGKKEVKIEYSYDVVWEKDVQIIPALP